MNSLAAARVVAPSVVASDRDVSGWRC